MILNIDLWPRLLEAFREFIQEVPEIDLAHGWSSSKERTNFYRGAMTPLTDCHEKNSGDHHATTICSSSSTYVGGNRQNFAPAAIRSLYSALGNGGFSCVTAR
jgi:hypothetical protein